MENVGAINSLPDASGPIHLEKFAAEPASRAGRVFRSVLDGVGSGLAAVAGAGTRLFAGLPLSYQELLVRQLEMQEQFQSVSLISNIEKSKHETQMAPIRNIRVG